MQDPRLVMPEEVSNPKPRKKRALSQVASMVQTQGENIQGDHLVLPPQLMKKRKVQKRNIKNEASPSFQQPERSTSDSLPDSSRSGNEYRALRRKYLLLEEEGFSVGRELAEVERDVKALENEKTALLDQLVVLEGLMDPSELIPLGQPVL